MNKLEKVIKGLECISNGAKQPCRDCEYSKCEEWCIAECAKDALALLKAQQPRVMTLEEALGGNECWIEGRSVACGYGDAVLTCDGERVDFYRPHSVYILDFYEYGLSWRCWTSKPTDGQRKAVKWE